MEAPYEENDEVPQNSVIRQDISEGSDVKRGDKVVLVVASRKKTVNVADAAGKTRNDAEKTLNEQGYKVKVLENFDANVESGRVISQSPVAGSAQIEGSVITIYVSKGKQPVTVTFNANQGTVEKQAQRFTILLHTAHFLRRQETVITLADGLHLLMEEQWLMPILRFPLQATIHCMLIGWQTDIW